MAYTYHELAEKTVQQLRDIAKDLHHEAVQGYSQMNKEHLLPALCRALGIPVHEHAEVVGIDKPAIKARLRQLKAKRAEALEAGDWAALKAVRRQRHTLIHRIRTHVARSA
jgi:DNA-binding IclR family transcriptional regulator